MALFIIFAIITIGVAIYGFYQTKKMVTSEMADVDFSKVIKKVLLVNAINSVAFVLMSVGIMIWQQFEGDAVHYLKLILGGLAFSMSLLTAVNFFIYFYYGKNIEKKLHDKIYVWFMVLYVAAFLTLFLWLDGFAPYLSYPIVNGINFTSGWTTPISGKPNLAFYAICILSGAVLVYFMCDHFLYIEYGKHGIVESTFLVAFPAGIIGARIWYCIGEGTPIQDWIKIWQGGLTILGGATMGIVAGVAWYMWKNKNYSIWVAVDLIVPTILIAQAVGRFGNFFNCEVHGNLTSVDNFKWLPEIIINNMKYSSTNSAAPDGQMYVPLFLIEGFVNFVGYFVLAHLFGKKLTKITEQGDLCFGYIIWYGLTRVIMEPFRNSSYNMGENGYWSWIWSLLFVFCGTLAILGNHLVRYQIKKHKNNYIVLKNDDKLGIIESGSFALIGLGLAIPGAILMFTNEFVEKIGFSNFNIGLMLLVVGVSILMLTVLSLIRFVEARKVITANGN